MGKLQRRKGAAYERWVANMFRNVLPEHDVKRGLQSRGGSEVPDVDAGMFWVECKHGRLPNVRKALAQSVADCPKGRIPMAVIRDNRSVDFCVLRFADFLELVKEWSDLVQQL